MSDLPRGWRWARLGECCEVVSGSTPRRDEPSYWGGTIAWATPRDLSALDGPVLEATTEQITKEGYESCSTTLLPAGAILFSSRAPVGLVAIARGPMCTNQGFKNLVPGPDIDSGYLYWCLKRLGPAIERRGSGTTFTEVSKEVVSRFQIPVPPLAEQQRIAAVLDKADAVRRKRRESLRLLDEFLRSAFLEMFGDPVRNEKGWELVNLGDVLAKPLRNGLSPADGGTVAAHVLTLTAITGSRFEPTAVKSAHFAHPAAPDQVACSLDFLICRGNGNLRLMGRGRFPRDIPDSTVFPDTMIAARVDTSRVEPSFLEAVWETSVVRRAVERGARTTSGIHKINQTVIMSTSFPLPVMDAQRRFAKLVERVTKLRERVTGGEDDALFDSLAQRAFTAR